MLHQHQHHLGSPYPPHRMKIAALERTPLVDYGLGHFPDARRGLTRQYRIHKAELWTGLHRHWVYHVLENGIERLKQSDVMVKFADEQLEGFRIITVLPGRLARVKPRPQALLAAQEALQ